MSIENQGCRDMKNIDWQKRQIIWLSLISIALTFFVAYFGYTIFQNQTPSLADLWSHWDTRWYLRIAANGYEKFGEGRVSITYFPLYPLMIRLINSVFKNSLASALAVSNVSYVVASIFLYKLVKKDFSQKAAWRTLVYFSIFPTAYFLHAGYTESLFLMFVFSAIYFAREKKWFLAGFLGMLATLTRFNGTILFPFFLAEYLEAKKFNFRRIGPDVLWVLLIFLGFGVYLLLNYQLFGNPLAFQAIYQEFTWEKLSLPWVGLIDAIGRFSRYQLTDWMIEGFTVIIFWLFDIVILITSLKKIRLSYKVFAWLSFGMMTTTSMWAGLPRYSLILFPIFMVLARWGRNPLQNYLIVTLSLFLQSIFLIHFIQGRFTF